MALPARAPSISDVATRAAVSQGTVSNVLNRPDVVAPATKLRVEQAIADLGFVRNESARQLGSGRSRAIGLVVLDVANPFFTDIARGAQSIARSRDASILIADSQEDATIERDNVELFLRQRVQGLLIAPTGGEPDWLPALVRSGTPHVLVDQRGLGGHCAVAVDDAAGGFLAADHLLSLGHRRLAFVGGPSVHLQIIERRSGAKRALARYPGASMLSVSTAGLNVGQGRRAADFLITLPDDERPTAVFAGNDLIALGILQGAVMNGVRVPEDIALIGYDDIDFAAGAAVPLSSVRQPREELGRAAMELLFTEISETTGRTTRPHEHRVVSFQPVLVARASTLGH